MSERQQAVYSTRPADCARHHDSTTAHTNTLPHPSSQSQGKPVAHQASSTGCQGGGLERRETERRQQHNTKEKGDVCSDTTNDKGSASGSASTQCMAASHPVISGTRHPVTWSHKQHTKTPEHTKTHLRDKTLPPAPAPVSSAHQSQQASGPQQPPLETCCWIFIHM